MEKFFKNPLYTGIAIFGILLVLVLYIWDEKKGNKDFYGLLKNSSTPAV